MMKSQNEKISRLFERIHSFNKAFDNRPDRAQPVTKVRQIVCVQPWLVLTDVCLGPKIGTVYNRTLEHFRQIESAQVLAPDRRPFANRLQVHLVDLDHSSNNVIDIYLYTLGSCCLVCRHHSCNMRPGQHRVGMLTR